MIKGSGVFLNRAMFNLTQQYQHWITAGRLRRTNPSPLSPTTSPSVSARRRLSLALSAVILWLFICLQDEPTAASASGMLQQMTDGVNFIRHNELYRTFIGLTCFNSIFGMSYVMLMPVFARDILDVGCRGFGFLQRAAGGGALVGMLTAAVVSHPGRQSLQTAVGATLFGIFLMLFALSPAYTLSVALVFALGLTS